MSNDRNSTRLLWLIPVRIEILKNFFLIKFKKKETNYFWGV
jgi:hypothetical protein